MSYFPIPMKPGCSPPFANLTRSFALALSYRSCANFTCSLDSALLALFSKISKINDSLSKISIFNFAARL